MKSILIAGLGLSALLTVGPAAAEPYQNLLTPLLESGVDVLGTPLDYPEGTPEVTAAIVELPPGAETGWHRHEVPLFAYVLEGEFTVDYGAHGTLARKATSATRGEFTVDYGAHGTRTYRAGDGVLEAMDVPHNGQNSGSVPVKLIAVYMGGGAEANTLSAPAP